MSSFTMWRSSGAELDGGAKQGGLGNKALRRPPLLRRVQDILRIPEDALDPCTG